MGIYNSAYVAYGLLIPVSPYVAYTSGQYPGDIVDAALSVPTVKAACPDVGHLEAGSYDRNNFYLVTECVNVDLGDRKRIGFSKDGRDIRDQEADWNRQLAHAVEIMGWVMFDDLEPPGWFVICDQS